MRLSSLPFIFQIQTTHDVQKRHDKPATINAVLFGLYLPGNPYEEDIADQADRIVDVLERTTGLLITDYELTTGVPENDSKEQPNTYIWCQTNCSSGPESLYLKII